ncbi:hypothetical protein GCM10022225_85130 [Plantactinospora mayteni]
MNVYIEFQVEHHARGSIDMGHDLDQRRHIGRLAPSEAAGHLLIGTTERDARESATYGDGLAGG